MKRSTGGLSGKDERLSKQDTSEPGIEDTVADQTEDFKYDTADDPTTEAFFRSDIDDLLVTPSKPLHEKGSFSEEGFDALEGLRWPSDIPVDIDDIIQETDIALTRIESQEKTQRSERLGKSGRKAPSTTDPQKPAAARIMSQQKEAGESAATSPLSPTGKEKSQATNEASARNNEAEAKASSYFRLAPVATSSASMRRARLSPNLASASSAREPAATGNPEGRLPAGHSVNPSTARPRGSIFSGPGPVPQSALGQGPLSANLSPDSTQSPLSPAAVLSPTTAMAPQMYAPTDERQAGDRVQSTRRWSSAAATMPHHNRDSRRRSTRDGDESSYSTDSGDSDRSYASFHRRSRRRTHRDSQGSRRSKERASRRGHSRDRVGSVYNTERQARAGPHYASRYSDATTAFYPQAQAYVQGAGYLQTPAYPQVATYPQAPVYPQGPTQASVPAQAAASQQLSPVAPPAARATAYQQSPPLAPAPTQTTSYQQALPLARAPAQAPTYQQPIPLAPAPPQAPVYTRAQAYSQPRGYTENPGPLQSSDYAPDHEFQRYSPGPVGRVAFAEGAAPVSRWNANSQRCMPAPVAAPPRVRDWHQWQPGLFEPSAPRYNPPRRSLPRYIPPPPPPPPVFSASSYGLWPGAGWDDDTCRCRSCCGECCKQVAAARREQRWMETMMRWSPAPPLWRPQPSQSFGPTPYGGGLLPARSTPWLWPTADAAAVSEPYWPSVAPTRQFAWSTRRLPRHVWSTGGSFLSRSRSCPPPGYGYIEATLPPGSGVSLSTTDVPSALERRYLPSGEFLEKRYSLMPEDGELLSPADSAAASESRYSAMPQQRRSSAAPGMASLQSTVTFGAPPAPSDGRETKSHSSLCEILTSISSCCAEPEEPPPVRSEIQRAKSISQQDLEAAYERSRVAGMPGKKSMTAEVSILLGSSDGRPTISISRSSKPLSPSVTTPTSLASPSALLGSSSTSPRSTDTASLMSSSDGLPRPASLEAAQAVVIPEASAMHGWYQPLHIVSQQTSESGSQQPLVPVVLAPAEQELLSGAGGAMAVFGADFFDFTWDAPEEGAWRGFGSARPDRGSAVESDADADRFSWSSDEMRRRREEAAEAGYGQGPEAYAKWSSDEMRWRREEAEAGSGQGPESGSEAEAAEAEEAGRTIVEGGEESVVPVAMETNMLRSAVSDEDVIVQQTEALRTEDMQSAADMQQVEEMDDVRRLSTADAWENREIREAEQRSGFQDDVKESEFVDVVPVVASASEGRFQAQKTESPPSSESESPQAFAAPVQTNPETGVVEAVATAPAQPPPPQPQPLPPPPPEAATSPLLAELIDEQKLQADKEAERIEKEIRDLELTSVELYPESRLVILLALLCIIWILFLILTAAVRHGVRPGGETTTSAGGSSHGHTTETSTSDESPPSPTRPTSKQPPPGSTGSTEEPLRDVFVCSTEYCKKEGDYLRGLTSQSSKLACEDFYEYVCEAWKKSATPLRDNQPGAAISTDTLLQRAMEDRLLAYIKDVTHADVAPARTMYERCTNRAEMDAALLDAKELFRSWGSQWPRTNSSGGAPDDVWRFAAKLLRFLGVPSFVGVEVGLEPKDLDKTIIEVGPPKGSIFFAKDVSEPRVMTLFTEATRSAAQVLSPNDADAANAASRDVSIALTTLSLLNLDDLGTSPLDFEVESFSALGRGVQAFMRVVFENVAVFSANTRIMVHRGPLVRREIDDTVSRASPRALLNYLGLLALVSLSPFLPERLAQLRVLHSVHALGRAEAPTTEQLCLRAAVQAYPACAVKASREVHKDVRRSLWLSQLEALFVDHVRDVSWMDNLTSLFVRYKMRHHRFERFFPARTLDECKPVATQGRPKAMDAFVEAVGLRQTQLLRQYGKNLLPVGLGSPLSVWARYRLCLQLLQVPVGLVNSSVPTNGTFFALHLSRFAVRLYAGLAQLLYEGTVYELEIPLYFTEEAERMLDEALDCLLCDARRRFPYGLDVDRVRNALLEQVLALQMGFLAFRELLGVRRIWRRDFQLSTFPGITADQLFFLYYALDNCELSDTVFESHQFEAHRRLPASVRVNMALRQSIRFAHAFGCAASSPMAAGVPCHLLR